MSEKNLPLTAEDLKPAPYNPRVISAHALSELNKMMAEFGDLSGIVWNKRTGNLIGAHQRLKNIPPSAAIIPEPDKPAPAGESWGYIKAKGHVWNIRIVDWSELKEKRANFVANNTLIQGQFDNDLLAELLAEVDYSTVGLTEVQVEASGFSTEQLEEILGRKPITDDTEQPIEVAQAAEQIREIVAAGNEAKAQKKSVVNAIRERMAENQPETGFYRLIVFGSDDEAAKFMQDIGHSPLERYVSGKELRSLLK